MQSFSDPIALEIIASLLAGTATGLGAIPIFLKKDFSRRTLILMIGIAAGVMLAASASSLLVPTLDMVTDWVGVITVVSFGNARLTTWGFMIGFVVMMMLDNIFEFLFG